MILVTGGSGYLGSHIVRRLLEAGDEVRVLVRDPAVARREARLDGLAIEWVAGDVTRPETLAEAMQGVEAVVHTVAIAIERGAATYEQVNAAGTLNVLEATRAAGIRRFINISQLGANPDLPYRFLASKGLAQQYVTESGLDWTAFRPSVIWGPEDEFVNTFARLARLTPLIFPIVAGPEARFQPVWVGDVAASVVKALRDPATFGEAYELGGPEVLTLEEIERRTLQAIGARRFMLRFPMPLLRVFVRLMEALLPNPPVTSSLLELLAVSNVTKDNALGRFVQEPRPFTAANAAEYMREFTVGGALRQFLGR